MQTREKCRVQYPELISGIVQLLFDDKPKVVQMAFEAYVTVTKLGDGERAWFFLNKCIEDQSILEELKAKVEVGTVPILTADSQLEFPHIFGDAGMLYGYSNTTTNTPSRFTSAGPTSKVENRNSFDIHSAARRPQTDIAIFYMIEIGNKPRFLWRSIATIRKWEFRGNHNTRD